MNDDLDQTLDALLREQFDGPVPDEGFCAAVIERLPNRPRRREWPLLAGVLAGLVLCGLSLRSAPITAAAWRDWLAGQLSAPVLTLLAVMMGMALLAMAWTITEAEDRRPLSARPG